MFNWGPIFKTSYDFPKIFSRGFENRAAERQQSCLVSIGTSRRSVQSTDIWLVAMPARQCNVHRLVNQHSCVCVCVCVCVCGSCLHPSVVV